MTLSISEILRGCTPGRKQSVGLMEVIPLVSDVEDLRFGTPEDLKLDTHQGYGNMGFENKSDKIVIVPSHVGYVTGQAAQDHAMCTAGMVKGKSHKVFDTAACIQRSQGGHIDDAGIEDMIILPYSLREKALSKRNDRRNIGKLWDDIARLNRKVGARADDAQIKFFLQHFEKQLNQFVAEFEIVPDQVGAIVLIDGHVVGVERAPTKAFWIAVWESLIRVCYGSLAIEVATQYGDKLPAPKNRVEVRKATSLKDLEAAVNEAAEADEEKTRAEIRKIVEDPFIIEQTEPFTQGLALNTIKNQQFVGQLVMDGDRVCYASMVTTQGWTKNVDWHEATKFKL